METGEGDEIKNIKELLRKTGSWNPLLKDGVDFLDGVAVGCYQLSKMLDEALPVNGPIREFSLRKLEKIYPGIDTKNKKFRDLMKKYGWYVSNQRGKVTFKKSST